MRSQSSHFTLAILILSSAPFGCSTGPVTDMDGDGDLLAIGAAAVEKRNCAMCHDPGDGSLSGQTTPRPGTMAYGANLTPDPDTGIGGWSGAQIIGALRYGIDDQRQALCAPMPIFDDLGDQEAEAIAAYLQSLPAVVKNIPLSTCAPAPAPGESFDGGAIDLLAADANAMPIEVADLAGAGSDRSLADASEIADASSSTGDAATPPSDLTTSPDQASSCPVRINELQTAGPGGSEDEFIELFNPCGHAIDLAGAHLVYRSATGTKDVSLIDFNAISIPANAFLVCGQTHFTGKADLVYKLDIASAGGGVALRDHAGAVMDSVGWGNATNAFVAGRAAPAPRSAQSIGRIPDGENSGDNSHDFVVCAMPTPGHWNH